MSAIIGRNLKIFFRDKASVFFSLLGVIIIIGLYVLFLGDVVVGNVEDMPDGRFLMDSWIMAGVLTAASITTTMGAFGVMVDDRSKKIFKDFASSPLSKRSLTSGYIVGTFIIGIIMTLAALVFAELYIVVSGGALLPPLTLLKVFGTVLLSVLTGSAIVSFVVSFFSSQNAFATASSIIGTLIGFLTGVYIPLSVMPESVQYVIKLFPLSHSAALLRQIMMEVPMETAFAGAPAAEVSKFRLDMGVDFAFGNTVVEPIVHILVLAGTAVLFYGLAIFNMSRKSRAS
ncbi:MAG TPA: ABC transporter [Ruminococcaceae bacterium]|nr:ABC transporter [Oscillospiraceae bacterium]